MKKPEVLLVLLLVFTIALRVFFAMQAETVESEGLFLARQVEYVQANGIPDYQDKLSFGGRIFLYPPLWVYLNALVGFLAPTLIAIKLLSAFLAGFTVFMVYLLAKQLTQSKSFGLLSAVFAALLPIYIEQTLLSGSVHALLLPLSLLFLKLYANPRPQLIFLVVLLVLVDAASFLLVITLLVFLLLQKINHQKLSENHKEYALFFLFLASWLYIITYKNALVASGARTIWQNLPPALLSSQFQTLTFGQAFAAMSVIPLILGVIGATRAVKSKNPLPQLLVAYTLTIVVFLLFRLENLHVGLMYVAVTVTILAAPGLKYLKTHVGRTRFASFYHPIIALILVLFALTAIIPFTAAAVSPASKVIPLVDVEALEWLSDHSREDQVTLATLNYGHAITYYAGTKNVIDENFLFIPDATNRYDDVQDFYHKQDVINAARVMEKYKVTYVLIPAGQEAPFITTSNCMIPLYNKTTLIYRNNCKVNS